MGADTVRLVRGLRQVELPRLVIVRRSTWRERLVACTLVSALVAAASYFHHRWQAAEAAHVDYLLEQDRQRSGTTEVVVSAEGVECKTPPLSPRWLDLVSDTCKSLGIAHRDMFRPKGGR